MAGDHMRILGSWGLGLCLASGVAGTAAAQGPPLAPAEIANCLCLRHAVDVLGGEMAAKQQALAELRAQLDRATTELEAARTHTDVNDPAAVARFREMLAQRDALFRRASGPAVSESASAVERFNQRSNEYNAQCANRPMDPGLVERAQATLACPAP